MPNPNSFSFDGQLSFLSIHALEQKTLLAKNDPAGSPWKLQMYLSLAESVKTARDHNLNCRKDLMVDSAAKTPVAAQSDERDAFLKWWEGQANWTGSPCAVAYQGWLARAALEKGEQNGSD